MVQGRRKEPIPVSCEKCGKTSLWYGGRRKRFCSPTCAKGSRYKPKPRERRIKGPQKQLSDRLKIERGHCADCHLVIDEYSVVIIDWDHRNPQDKAFTISRKLNRVSDTDLLIEIGKCDAVCANCHRYRTHLGKHHLTRRNQQPDTQPTLFTHD